ncbi:AraC family transcriptional regulator [Saccharibacillus sp. O23]|uniref:AraC family transcriptional regulator n=1 Tax=Saccharibacillus sp. O23 TaxID=2009338 RepID=UPI000B4E3778|nr:AraC family transcriptional regulator [Saccharibacillus sp. O23]OWR32675.1 AraC family transcriptional regulator [Saccharibacillus sp. O23]
MLTNSGNTEQLAELASLIALRTPSDGVFPSGVPSLCFRRVSRPIKPEPSFAHASLYLIVQGSKTITLKGEQVRFGPLHYLINPIHLPVTAEIDEASAERPYLSLQLEFSVEEIREALGESPPISDADPLSAMFANPTTPEILDAALRLVRLSQRPEDVRFLAPLATREILYHALRSEQGAWIARFALPSSLPHRIARIADRIKREYDRSLPVSELAEEAHLSPASLHKHFKALTGMSPIQYQKTIRLQTARQLMFFSGLAAAEAAFRVGYESPSQFSREYARMFGLPPKKETERRLAEKSR